MSLKQPGALVSNLGSCPTAMPFIEPNASKMSPVERYMPAPVVRIQRQTSSLPQLQAEKRMSRPERRSAWPMRR